MPKQFVNMMMTQMSSRCKNSRLNRQILHKLIPTKRKVNNHKKPFPIQSSMKIYHSLKVNHKNENPTKGKKVKNNKTQF